MGLGGDSTESGLLVAVFPLVAFISTPVFSYLCGALPPLQVGTSAAYVGGGRTTVLLLGLVLSTVSTIVFGLSNKLALFFIMRSLQGLGAAASSTAGGALLIDAFPKQIGETIGTVSKGHGMWVEVFTIMAYHLPLPRP